MANYEDCAEYLHALGLPMEISKRICKKYESTQDMAGLIDYIFLCETMEDSCVDQL